MSTLVAELENVRAELAAATATVSSAEKIVRLFVSIYSAIDANLFFLKIDFCMIY